MREGELEIVHNISIHRVMDFDRILFILLVLFHYVYH